MRCSSVGKAMALVTSDCCRVPVSVHFRLHFVQSANKFDHLFVKYVSSMLLLLVLVYDCLVVFRLGLPGECVYMLRTTEAFFCICSERTISFLNSVSLVAVVSCCIVALHILVFRCVYHEVSLAPSTNSSYLHPQCILLGAVPFPSDVPRLKQLGVQGVVTLNEPYETLVPMSLYQDYGIDHLVIATRDYCFAPSLEDICRAIEFIHHNASQGGTTYVHCKAGRGRSTTIVLCYLIKYRSMTPEAALDHVRSIRPRVLLAPSQWQAVIVFSTLTTGRLPVRSTNLNCYVEGSKASIPDREIDDYSMEFDYEDGGLPLCQVMLPTPSSPTGCIDAVFITEADLEGYDMHIDTGKSVISLEVVASRKPIMRRLSCLFGSLRLTNNCEPAPSRFTEVRAC